MGRNRPPFSGPWAPPAMKNRWLPALVLTPSVVLVGACVYGFIAFTVYLSFTASTLLPVSGSNSVMLSISSPKKLMRQALSS